MPVIAVENLKYRYPNTESLALDGLSFTVEKGEFIGIVGENGAGKSTLSQALIGLVPQFYKGAYGGRVLIEDLPAETTPISELCCKVGLVFQNPFNQLSGAKDNVYEEVAFGMQNLGVPREEMHRRAEEALKLLDIWQYRDRNPFDLSGGQMQRVAIASVLVMNPDILVLDEPTSQLDPQGSEEVFRTVDKLARSGITILMIEQKIEKIAAYCDRILLLHKGRQIAFDTPQKIFSRTDLEELGVQPPAFTRICRALGAALPDGSYPVTAEEAAGRLHRVESIQPPPAVPVETRPVLFEIEKLRFSYRPGTPVLHEISLTLDAPSHRHHRPERRRQNDACQAAQGPAPARRRRHSVPRRGHRRAHRRIAGRPGRLCVPEPRRPDLPLQRPRRGHVRPAEHRHGRKDRPGKVPRSTRHDRPGRPGGPQPLRPRTL